MPVSCSAKTNPRDTRIADGQSRPLGNSERIRLKFGSFGIGVLENSPGIRVSNLYSSHDGVNINRTLAVVAYTDVIEKAYRREHEAIINGQSIGIVFEQNGWLIDKHHRYFGEIEILPAHFGIPSASGAAAKTRAAIHVYSLLITKNGQRFQYASIAEIHHPDFLSLHDLATIYGADFKAHLEKRKNVGDFLQVIESRVKAL